jgi:DNA-binding beta-propeller fold protein YncE
MTLKTATCAVILAIVAVLQSAQCVRAEATGEISIVATIPRGGDFIDFGFDSLWMMSGRKLVRINPADNTFIATPIKGALGSYPGILAGKDAIWIPDVGRKTIYKVDPQTSSVIMEIPSDIVESEGRIGADENSVWAVTGSGSDQLTRYDAGSGKRIANVSMPASGAGVVVGFGSVWVTSPEKGELYRVDPSTNKIIATIGLRAKPRFLAIGEGSVWVLNQGDGTVQRIDGNSEKILATIEVGVKGAGGDITVGGGSVWVSTLSISLIQIDPLTNTLRGKFKRPSGVYVGDGIRYGAGSLWISGDSVFRIDPPK